MNPHSGRRAEGSPVKIPIGAITLEGAVDAPATPRGAVLFAHGSGSSRLSPRNRFVAGVLRDSGLATLLTDLLTPQEEEADAATGHLRFDIELLGDRLVRITDWLFAYPATRGLPIGYFGASTGAAAALVAAAQRPIAAVVSRGGRPDLARSVLRQVRAPTLLIVGECDDVVLTLNKEALMELQGERELAVVAGATHLFPEPGALEEVARLARGWFVRHLGGAGARDQGA
jgi:putative phosphoribosyl transferase